MNNKKTESIIKIGFKTFFSFMCFLAGFAFIAMGAFLLPFIKIQLIDLGRNNINLFIFLFSGGIAMGSIIFSYIGLNIFWNFDRKRIKK